MARRQRRLNAGSQPRSWWAGAVRSAADAAGGGSAGARQAKLVSHLLVDGQGRATERSRASTLPRLGGCTRRPRLDSILMSPLLPWALKADLISRVLVLILREVGDQVEGELVGGAGGALQRREAVAEFEAAGACRRARSRRLGNSPFLMRSTMSLTWGWRTGWAILPVLTWFSTCSALVGWGVPASKALACTRRKAPPLRMAPLMSLVKEPARAAPCSCRCQRHRCRCFC